MFPYHCCSELVGKAWIVGQAFRSFSCVNDPGVGDFDVKTIFNNITEDTTHAFDVVSFSKTPFFTPDQAPRMADTKIQTALDGFLDVMASDTRISTYVILNGCTNSKEDHVNMKMPAWLREQCHRSMCDSQIPASGVPSEPLPRPLKFESCKEQEN